jgi:hypothetical protein
MTGKHSATQYAKEFTTESGILAAAPILLDGNHRLMLFLEKPPVAEKKPKPLTDAMTGEALPEPSEEELEQAKREIIVAIAENEENSDILVRLHKLLVESGGTPIYIYGKQIPRGSRWKEYADGIDFYVVAVGVFVPSANKPFIIQTTYGDHWTDSIEWRGFVVKVLKSGVKVVKP